MTNEEIMAQQFPKEFEPSLEVAQSLIATTPAFVQMPEPPAEAFKFIEEARIANERATATPEEFFAEGTSRNTVEGPPPFIIPVEAQTGPWALNVSESGEAAVASSEARAAELEQFYAEGTTPLAETTPASVEITETKEFKDLLTGLIEKAKSEDLPKNDVADLWKAGDSEPKKYKPINVERFSEGLYNQREVVKVDGDRTQLTEAQMSGVVGEVLAQTITESQVKPTIIDDLLLTRIVKLEETNTKIIAALKHLGLDTNKHFR